mmetsp:Transcript_43643/g.105822  ORF Transcript_43643/g.105822 Transcript_43643/m.105822 type:complete len:206 (+) Transcript_43643:253-870(+)
MGRLILVIDRASLKTSSTSSLSSIESSSYPNTSVRRARYAFPAAARTSAGVGLKSRAPSATVPVLALKLLTSSTSIGICSKLTTVWWRSGKTPDSDSAVTDGVAQVLKASRTCCGTWMVVSAPSSCCCLLPIPLPTTPPPPPPPPNGNGGNHVFKKGGTAFAPTQRTASVNNSSDGNSPFVAALASFNPTLTESFDVGNGGCLVG